MKLTEKQKMNKQAATNAWYLEIVGCPQCKKALVAQGQFLHCNHCQVDYPVENGIPALLAPELSLALHHGLAPVKHFYYTEERYDWTRDPRGFELAYHRYRKWETWRQIARMLEPQDIVLDLGCGTGLITCQFVWRVQMVLAIDLNRWALSQMDGKPWIIKIQADGESLPVQDESVDLIVATEVIEHLEAPGNVAGEVFRVCKKGGHVIGSVPSTSKVWKWRQHLSVTYGGGEPFHQNFTKGGIIDLWQKAGFKVTVVQGSCLGLNWMWILEKP